MGVLEENEVLIVHDEPSTPSSVDRVLFPLQWLTLFTVTGLTASAFAVLFGLPEDFLSLLFPASPSGIALGIFILIMPCFFFWIGGIIVLLFIARDREIDGHSAKSKLAIDTYVVGYGAFGLILHLMYLNSLPSFEMPWEYIFPASAAWSIISSIVGRSIERNNTIGVRNKWSSSSEHLWSRTQRFRSFEKVILGFVFLCMGVFCPNVTGLHISLGAALLAIAAAHIYSYVIYRQELNEVSIPLTSV